jgi:hypothetical protein
MSWRPSVVTAVFRALIIVSMGLLASAVAIHAGAMSASMTRLVGTIAAFPVLLSAFVVTFWPRRLSSPTQYVARSSAGVGLLIGLLWAMEICINNVLQPPLPLRDYLDDGFWALVAAGILVIAMVWGLRRRRFSASLVAGLWAGLGTGVVACATGLAFVVFGMSRLLSDRPNIEEWSGLGGGPGMADYFAYETLAGALLHLVGLGAGMGVVLGLLAGGVVKVVTGRSQIAGTPPR